MLDNAVGEYDAVTKIKKLDRTPLPPNPSVALISTPSASCRYLFDETHKLGLEKIIARQVAQPNDATRLMAQRLP